MGIGIYRVWKVRYIYLKLEYDQDKWLGIPEVTLLTSGLKLFDPATGTIAYSENFSLMAYDMLTRPSQRGGFGLDKWHGPVPSDPVVELAGIEMCKQYCITKGWTGGMPLNDDANFADLFYQILDCFRGEIVPSEGLYKLRFKDMNHETIVKDIIEENIAVRNGRTTLKIKPVADLYETSNAIDVEFFNVDLKYQTDKFLKSDTTAIATEAGMRKTTRKLLGLNSLEKVQPMAAYYLERSRWGHRAEMQVIDAFLELEAMDLVTLTHEMPGWDKRPMRVLSMGYDPTDSVFAIELEEEDTHLYDDIYDPSLLQWYTTTLPNMSASPPSVRNVSIFEVLAPVRLRSATRLVVEFDPPERYPWWDGAQVWVRIGSGQWSMVTVARDSYFLDGVEEGQTYTIKLVSINLMGVRENFELAYTAERIITGVATAPPNLTGMTAAANGDSVSIYANPLESADVDGYEVRLGAVWLGAIFVSFNKAPSLRLNGVRPGIHTFWMAARATNGLYATNPVFAVCRVFIPVGLTSAHSAQWNYAAGTFVNTEMIVYNNSNMLRCAHTDGVLTGTWTSPTFDMGSLKITRCWADFLTTFISPTSTWAGVMPEPLTWGQIGVLTRTWSQIFAPSAAAQLKATLMFSENGTDWTSVDYFEILSAESYARYLRVKIEITDPMPETYLYVNTLNLSVYQGAT